MARRTKAELQAANYYVWLEVCSAIRERKKAGVKPTREEKLLMKTVPTPEKPFKALVVEVQQSATTVKKHKPMSKIDFDKNVIWPVKANNFLCAVFNVPYTDEQCLLFCERKDCPFYQVGYFRAHGVQY